VAAVDPGPAGVEIRLEDGSLLHAERALLATNGYTARLLPGTDVVPARGQVLLTAPIPGLALRGTFHHDEGFHYFRDHQGAVLLGGGRNLDRHSETTDAHGTTEHIQDHLEQMLREIILPGIPFTIANRWSGIMGFRAHGKEPLVQRVHERMVVAAGLSGMGVAIGIRVARRAAALL
jgi:gamma-glutamylputrescine oxidase